MGHKNTHRKLDALKAKLEALCAQETSLSSTDEESSLSESSNSPSPPPTKSARLKVNRYKTKVNISLM